MAGCFIISISVAHPSMPPFRKFTAQRVVQLMPFIIVQQAAHRQQDRPDAIVPQATVSFLLNQVMPRSYDERLSCNKNIRFASLCGSMSATRSFSRRNESSGNREPAPVLPVHLSASLSGRRPPGPGLPGPCSGKRSHQRDPFLGNELALACKGTQDRAVQMSFLATTISASFQRSLWPSA